MAERLQKFLAKSGIGSRRYCENLIKSNQITLNGKIAEIGSVVHQDDIIEYEGKIITYTESETKLLILNKPEKVLSSSKREKNIPIAVSYTHLTLPTKA